MMSDDFADSIAEIFQTLFEENRDRQEAIDRLYSTLDSRGWLSRVIVHQYLCPRGEPLATVFKVSGLTLCHVRDYKYSPGLNLVKSVAAARAKNTLDGDRHWPSHTYDVEQLARFDTGDTKAGMTVNCRHFAGTLLASEVLSDIEGVKPGRKGKPTRLGT